MTSKEAYDIGVSLALLEIEKVATLPGHTLLRKPGLLNWLRRLFARKAPDQPLSIIPKRVGHWVPQDPRTTRMWEAGPFGHRQTRRLLVKDLSEIRVPEWMKGYTPVASAGYPSGKTLITAPPGWSYTWQGKVIRPPGRWTKVPGSKYEIQYPREPIPDAPWQPGMRPMSSMLEGWRF